jgi:threonine dehydrogenase-like Zn-dependent dehydrogenase
MVWQGPGTSHAAIAVPGVTLGPGDALVAVELATICPDDAATVLGVTGASVPLVLGHEQVGRVVAVGPDATTSGGTRLVVGMRIVWSRRIGCGDCDSCRIGVTADCAAPREYGADRLRRGWELSGGFASHVLVRAGTTILTVPEVVPATVLAPLSCATALAAAAVEHITQVVDVDGETVVVSGADLAGLTVTAMLADEGAHAVVVESDATRRSRALDFGAHGVAAGLDDLERLIRSGRVPGAGSRGAGHRLDGPVAVVGSGALASESWSGSSVWHSLAVVVRLAESPPPAAGYPEGSVSNGAGAPSSPWPDGTPVITLRRTEPRHLVTAVDFASNAWFRYPFGELVAARFPLERLDDALQAAAGEASALRIAVDPAVR